MTCSRCGAIYNTLVCPACTERVNRESILRGQPPYLARAFAGEFDLILCRKEKRKPHVQMFGDERHAFCGESLAEGRRTKISTNVLLIDSICEPCAQVIADLMQTTVREL